MIKVSEMNSSAHSITFDNGVTVAGIICSLGKDGYTLPCYVEGSRSVTGKFKRWAKDAAKRGESIYVDTRYIE